jgi:hypothetical protein
MVRLCLPARFGCDFRAKELDDPITPGMKRLVSSCVVSVCVHQASVSPVPDAETSTLQRKRTHTPHTDSGELASVMRQISQAISPLIMHPFINQPQVEVSTVWIHYRHVSKAVSSISGQPSTVFRERIRLFRSRFCAAIRETT